MVFKFGSFFDNHGLKICFQAFLTCQTRFYMLEMGRSDDKTYLQTKHIFNGTHKYFVKNKVKC